MKKAYLLYRERTGVRHLSGLWSPSRNVALQRRGPGCLRTRNASAPSLHAGWTEPHLLATCSSRARRQSQHARRAAEGARVALSSPTEGLLVPHHALRFIIALNALKEEGWVVVHRDGGGVLLTRDCPAWWRQTIPGWEIVVGFITGFVGWGIGAALARLAL